MFGYLSLMIIMGVLIKSTIDDHKKYDAGDDDGVPFWFSSIAFFLAPVVLILFPSSVGVPLWITIPCEIVYAALAIPKITRSARKKMKR
nr:MAG TPA: hypothetical protein [Caudoviricetes sp.]